MFEKEAEEYVPNINWRAYSSKEIREEMMACYRKGAEFGYNKANEWNAETPLDAVGNKDLLLRVEKDDFDVGYYHFEKKRFYTNDGREVTPLAWKVIVPPERKPEVEG